MYKIFSLLLIISAILTLSACSQDIFGDYTVKYSYTSSVSSVSSVENKTATSDAMKFTKTVERGQMATLKIKDKPNTKYEITVLLSSGPSKAAALSPKKSDKNGKVIWKWKISSNTKPGNYSVTVKNADTGKTVFFDTITII